MADVIELLRRLQDLDSNLYELRRQEEQKPLELEQFKQRLAEQEAKAKAAEAHLTILQLQHKEQDIELSTKESHVKKLQLQLFQVKTNKEYTAIQHEIEQGKADISLVEEHILMLLDAIEQATRDHRTQLAQVTAQQTALREHEARVTQELARLAEETAVLEQQRQEVTPLVQREALSMYERVLANREGLAMVPLVNESCGGCHMVQPPQIVSEAYLKAKLVTCDSCNRILYVNNSGN